MALNNAQYNILQRRYEAKQLENQHIVMERMQNVYAKLPQLAKIDDSISSLSIAQAKKLIDGDETAMSELRRKLKELSIRSPISGRSWTSKIFRIFPTIIIHKTRSTPPQA